MPIESSTSSISPRTMRFVAWAKFSTIPSTSSVVMARGISMGTEKSGAGIAEGARLGRCSQAVVSETRRPRWPICARIGTSWACVASAKRR